MYNAKNETMNALRKNTLILFGLIMLAAIIRAFIPANYQKTATETITIDSSQPIFHYMQLHRIVAGNKFSNYEIIDLRTSVDFTKDHLQGAKNIPYKEFANSELFSEGSKKPILLYADTEAKAANAAFILLQTGIDNARYIPGNFETIKVFVLQNFNLEYAFYNEEKMKYNYKSYFSGSAHDSEQNKTSKPTTPRNMVQAASGGC